MTIAQKILQSTRMIHLCLLFAAVAYLVLPLLVGGPKSQMDSQVVVAALGVVALSNLGAAIFSEVAWFSRQAKRCAKTPRTKPLLCDGARALFSLSFFAKVWSCSAWC